MFNAYGPGQHLPPAHAPVIPNFLRQAINNGTLVTHGDGSQTRDYVYVDDVVQAMVVAATASNINQRIINIGSGKETTVAELVGLVIKITGKNPEIIYNQRDDRGPNRMCADISQAREVLNYQPSIDLETGLRITLENDSRFSLK